MNNVRSYLFPFAIPHGISPAGAGRLAVFLSPRLIIGDDLASHPDWLDWPAVVDQLTFTVRINGTTLAPASVSMPNPQHDSATWQAVFDKSTPVTTFQHSDLSQVALDTFPESEFIDDVRALYADIALTEPDDAPRPAQLLQRATAQAVLGNGDGDEHPGLRAILAHLRRRRGPNQPRPTQETFDFHQYVSLLGQHPELLRRLGIVVDLEVPVPPFVDTVQVSTDWAFRPAWQPPAPQVLREFPSLTCTTPDFWPRSETDDQVGQHLALSRPGTPWRVQDLDAVSAATKLGEALRDLKQGTATTGALPPQQEVGIALNEIDRAANTSLRFTRMQQLEQRAQLGLQLGDQPVELCAEDLVIGHRIDVRSSGAPAWRSLFARQATSYRFPADPTRDYVPDADEGRTAAGLTRPTEPGTGPALVRERVALWNGWGLAIPPPGQVVDPSDGSVADPPRSAPPTASPVQFDTSYGIVPKSLPRLRYGDEYRLRARCVFLGGWSRAVGESQDATAVSAEERFGRYAPINAPSVLRRSPRPTPGVGESTTRVVLRSWEWDTPSVDVVPDDRLIFPPTGSASLWERHGVLRKGLNPRNFEFFAANDGRSPADQVDRDDRTGEPVAGVRDQDGELVAGPAQVTASYLHDPVIAGCAAHGLPGRPNKAVVIALAADGDLRRTARLRFLASDRTERPERGAAADAPLLVHLPKATCTDVEISARIRPPHIEQFGWFQQMLERDPAGAEALRRQIRDGRHWMFSSRTTITLVHAVRQPLEIPEIDLQANRAAIGASVVDVTGSVDMNRASTGRTTFRATWTDPVDRLADVAPTTVDRSIVLGTTVHEKNEDLPDSDAVQLAPDLHDAKRHTLTVTAESYTRFRDEFTVESVVTMTGDVGAMTPEGVAPGTVVLTSSDATTTWHRGTDFTVDAEAGTFTRTTTGSLAAATTVTARYVPLPISRLSTEGGVEEAVVVVPNARVPSALEIDEILPSFARVRSEPAPDVVRVDHTGSVLRIWIARPWWSTGEEERVGVLLDAETASQAGRDAVAGGAPVADMSTADFPRATETSSGVTGAEPGTFDVAGHDPVFAPDRDQWFCDVEMQVASYRPIVRLALARHQAISIPGAHIGPAHRMVPLRLGVNRATTLRLLGNGNLRMQHEGLEHDGIRDRFGATRQNEVEVTFQERDPAITDDHLGWRTIVGPLTASRTIKGNGDTRWQVIAAPPTSALAVRMVVEEYEQVVDQTDVGSERDGRVCVHTETIDVPARFLA